MQRKGRRIHRYVTLRFVVISHERREKEMELLEIHDRYYDRVKKFISRLIKDTWIAEDLTQETFIRVEKHIGSVRDMSKLSSWVFRIAYNLCQDYFKSQKTKSHNKERTEILLRPFAEMTVQKDLEQHQMGACVQEQIHLLPESLRAVIVLYDFIGFNHAEVAEILEISTANAKVRLHRARKALKAILEEKCTFELDERNVLVCVPLENKNTNN